MRCQIQEIVQFVSDGKERHELLQACKFSFFKSFNYINCRMLLLDWPVILRASNVFNRYPIHQIVLIQILQYLQIFHRIAHGDPDELISRLSMGDLKLNKLYLVYNFFKYI